MSNTGGYQKVNKILLKSEELKRIMEQYGIHKDDLPKCIPEDISSSKYVAVIEGNKWNELKKKLSPQECEALRVENKHIVIDIEKIEEMRGKKAPYAKNVFGSLTGYSGHTKYEPKYRKSRYPEVNREILERTAKYLGCDCKELTVSSPEDMSDEMVCVDMKLLERYRSDDFDEFIKACKWPEYKILLFNYIKNRSQVVESDSVAGILYILECKMEDIIVTGLEEQIQRYIKKAFPENDDYDKMDEFFPTVILIVWDKIKERQYKSGIIYYIEDEEDIYHVYLPFTESECSKFDENHPWEIEVEASGREEDFNKWEENIKEQIEEWIEEKKIETVKGKQSPESFNNEVDELISKMWESELIEFVREEDENKEWEILYGLWGRILHRIVNDREYARNLFEEFGMTSPF